MSKKIREQIERVKNLKLLNEKLILGSKERVHLSKKPINDLERVKYKDIHGKPGGLWYGFGDNWINFKKYGVTWNAGDTPLSSIMGDEIYIYKLYLDFTNILVLDSEDSVEEFTNKYSVNNNYPQNISWEKVGENYKGIEFPNYEQLGVRNWYKYSKKYMWLYNIDINSGCVWDSSAITKIRLL